MRINYNRGNAYFDTYYVYDKEGHQIGILEDHCRGVKEEYFVGWRKKENSDSWETKSPIDTKEETLKYIAREI
jgi:hypothetical protein